MGARWLVVFALLGGCGRLGFDTGRADATMDTPPMVCTWSAPQRMSAEVQSVSDDWFPAVTIDGNEIFFHSFRTGSLSGDLWRAARSSAAVPFDPPVRIAELDTASFEQGPTITGDRRILVFAREDTMTRFHLFASDRPDTSALWNPPVQLANVGGGTDNDYSPWISTDGTRLLFSSERVGSQNTDLYETTRSGVGSAFTAPNRITELASSTDDAAPTLSADGLEIFFVSRRATGNDYDVWTSKRPSVTQPFTPPTRVAELSSARDETGTRLSDDSLTIYLNYDTRTGGSANSDLWIATRPCF